MLAVTFRCPSCGRQVAMLANPMETQLVNSLCVDMSAGTDRGQPFGSVRTHLRPDADAQPQRSGTMGGPAWSDEAETRLARVPTFVRGMVRRLYTEWAQDNGIEEITAKVMDEARSDLGLEGM
jgi:hypothetical protein